MEKPDANDLWFLIKLLRAAHAVVVREWPEAFGPYVEPPDAMTFGEAVLEELDRATPALRDDTGLPSAEPPTGA